MDAAAACWFQVRPDCITGMRCLLGMVQGYSSSHTGSSSAAPQAAAAGGSVSPQPLQPKPSAGVMLLRQVDQYQLWPTAEQLHLVDKKFGGGCCGYLACVHASWGCQLVTAIKTGSVMV